MELSGGGSATNRYTPSRFVGMASCVLILDLKAMTVANQGKQKYSVYNSQQLPRRVNIGLIECDIIVLVCSHHMANMVDILKQATKSRKFCLYF